jgi:hypothetical protein
MRHFLKRLLVLFGFIASARCASANAGTPLMWAEMFHLVFGNALIGLGEGLLLARLCSLPRGKTVLAMILANYVSAWLGALFIGGAMVQSLPMDLNNGRSWFWCMVGVTYAMTLVIEWPFVGWSLRGTQQWFKRSMRSSLIVQSASYVILFACYWMVSGTSLYTRMKVVSPGEISMPDGVSVYYIEPLDGSVNRRPLVGGEKERIFGLDSKDEDDRLFVRRSELDTNRWDLLARLESKRRGDPLFVDVLTNLLVEATQDWRVEDWRSDIDSPQNDGTSMNFGYVPSLGNATNSPWEFRTGYWPLEGLRATDTIRNQLVRFSYETPFGAWRVRNAVHLRGDKVLFQLGDNQICIFDPATRRVALLWHGRGPVAVIEKSRFELGAERIGITQARED